MGVRAEGGKSQRCAASREERKKRKGTGEKVEEGKVTLLPWTAG